ncbi:MAG: SAM-dependent methyltransferase [Candidatus Heimdallarchaeota archaeon]|nr:SAM-dependent methyltransferase [Candidatus Heimdallarchaeota archaeon]
MMVNMPKVLVWFAVSVFILGLLIIISIGWPSGKGAPWRPTPRKKVQKMLAMADIKPGEVIYDLGCGDGRIVIMAARRYNIKAVGIEIDFLRYIWCKIIIALLGLRKKVRVIYGDLFDQNLSEADVVICYLTQSTNNRLEQKLIEELKPGARIVSNTFYFHELPMVTKDNLYSIYVYHTWKERKENPENQEALINEEGGKK